MFGPSWHSDYRTLHRTASNFRSGRAEHSVLDYDESGESNDGGSCRCLALSTKYLAGGFSDGTLRVFNINSKECICTLKPVHENRIGLHSRAITGLFLDDDRVIFASLDGSVFVGNILPGQYRRAHLGNVLNDGALVDFTGTASWWVGLYAGTPGHAIHIWNAASEDVIYNGGDVTDSDALRGWHLLTDQLDHIARIRISEDRLLLIATRSMLCVIDIESHGISTNLNYPDQVLRDTLDVKGSRAFVVSANGVGRVLASETLLELTRLQMRPMPEDATVYGALNSWHVFLCDSGVIDVWNASLGVHLYRLPEQLSDVCDFVASNGCLACCGADNGLHLWDFSL